MAFESGAISFRAFYIPDGLADDCVARFAAHAGPALEGLGREPVSGWVTGRHLLDRHITEDTAFVAGYLRLTLLKAERRIPEPLLRAHCRMEEFAEMAAQGTDFLKREVRAQIRKTVTEQLLPGMPPTLSGIPFVYDRQNMCLYAGAMGDKQVDSLSVAFERTTRRKMVPLVPETAALKRRHYDARDLPPTSFSPECEDSTAESGLGRDFLTWLWFYAEAQGGLVQVDGLGEFGILMEGPLLFVSEGDGAHEAVLRKGAPLVSAEAKAALLAGKKLRCGRLTLVRGEEQWTATVDADRFAFRSLKLPEEQPLDPISRFQGRMLGLQTFLDVFLDLFDHFLDQRMDAGRWQKVRKEIHHWVTQRTARH